MVIGIALTLWSSGAAAQDRSTARACARDITARCAGVQPGEGRIRACIKEHFQDLSESCQARLTKLAAVAKTCVPDVKEKCASVKPGRGRIARVAACLKSELASLSDPCKDALTQAVAGAR
jgi:hypothetical protein